MELTDWIGREEEGTDVIAVDRVRAMEATLDREPDLGSGSSLPPLWHWLFFNPAVPAREIGSDGHPKRGGFLPPVPLPRRMWAGGRFRFERPLLVGHEARRTSRILDVREKNGRSGALCFVTVEHRIEQSELCFVEEHDIVYRAMPDGPAEPQRIDPPQRHATASRTVIADPVMLFRYSALTFNGHRIHYDRDYATGTEHYPGLVVHGPLIATLLCEIGPQAYRTFEYRAAAPLFDSAPFAVHTDGKGRSWALTPDGGLAMDATFTT